MEYDRYQQNHKFYIIGLICLVLCITFFLFTLYITPYLIWNLPYEIPDIVISLINYFHTEYEYSDGTSRLIVGLLFLIPCIITGFISDYVSNKIDNKIFKVEPDHEETVLEEQEKEEKSSDMRESASLGGKILVLMILCVLGVLLFQLLI